MKKKPSYFILSKKNQKGQVAIFVALIFQIVFIFFALLINVGLLVHHKINLQQSTDLAAYYGAMKQAEMLNVTAHINFQIRQAWKLLTWRYRILGTFGSENPTNVQTEFKMPIQFAPSFSFTQPQQRCQNGAVAGEDLTTLPAFCVGHVGYSDYNANGTETKCRIQCNNLGGAASVMNAIRAPGVTIDIGGTASAVIRAIGTANNQIADLCQRSTVSGIIQLSKLLAAYSEDVENKKKNIKLLLNNLSADSEKFIDLDAKLVKTGALNTFKNNLTEANRSSIELETTFNGISSDNANQQNCGYSMQGTGNLVSEIKFEFIQFFMQYCAANSSGTASELISIFENGLSELDSRIVREITPNNPGLANSINALLGNKLSLGYEKNPWCGVYYGVKAKTKPKIPFLPLSAIELSATSFAKPFGGSLGPSYYSTWNAGENSSSVGQKVDQRLPSKTIDTNGAQGLAQNKSLLMNYSNFVGDPLGLEDYNYVAIYHNFLLTQSIRAQDPISQNKSTANTLPRFDKAGRQWPTLSDWDVTIENSAIAQSKEYDPIVYDKQNSQNSFMRDLEISVVAPNQFDLTYYSIEPDFYNNYYKNKLDNLGTNKLVDELKSMASVNEAIAFRPDYGYNKELGENRRSIPTGYSVLHQLGVVEKIFKAGNGSELLPGVYQADKYFNFIPKSPASLLTGWTFKNLTNALGYEDFPMNPAETTMPFGQCNKNGVEDQANTEYKSLTEYAAPTGGGQLPPTPGNCVTGGRTGYSVKIVSQEAINGQQGAIGGENTGGVLRNQIPKEFLSF